MLSITAQGSASFPGRPCAAHTQGLLCMHTAQLCTHRAQLCPHSAQLPIINAARACTHDCCWSLHANAAQHIPCTHLHPCNIVQTYQCMACTCRAGVLVGADAATFSRHCQAATCDSARLPQCYEHCRAKDSDSQLASAWRLVQVQQVYSVSLTVPLVLAANNLMAAQLQADQLTTGSNATAALASALAAGLIAGPALRHVASDACCCLNKHAAMHHHYSLAVAALRAILCLVIITKAQHIPFPKSSLVALGSPHRKGLQRFLLVLIA